MGPVTGGDEIFIKGEKYILRYSQKDEEYWLMNVNEYFNMGKIDTASQRPLSRSLFFSLITAVIIFINFLFVSSDKYFSCDVVADFVM